MFNIFGVGCISLELRMSDSIDLCWLCWRRARAEFVRHTNLSECCVWFHLRSILNVILWVNLVRGVPGCTFLLWNLISRWWNFRKSICLIREILWKFMFVVRSEDHVIAPSISRNRRYESTVSGNRTRVLWEYVGAGCAGYNERLQSMLWMKSLDVVTLEAMSSRDLSDELYDKYWL